MKKTFRYYTAVWAILLALFNVIAFVSPGWIGQEKYTASFWIGYVFISITFVGQLVCAYYAMRETNAKKFFYNVSLITTSYTGLILSFVFGGLCMLISPLPYWVGVLVCVILLALNAIAVIKAAAAVDIVTEIDKKVKAKTFFIKSLTVDADSLMQCAKSEEAKTLCKKVYESVRYSDPMSDDALSAMEDDISATFAKLRAAVEKDDKPQTEKLAEELIRLIDKRNKKCMLLK